MNGRENNLSIISIGANTYKYDHHNDISGTIEWALFEFCDGCCIHPGSTVLDIRAGIGDFSAIASRKVGARRRVIAVQPNTDDSECRLASISLSGLETVVPTNTAVAEGE